MVPISSGPAGGIGTDKIARAEAVDGAHEAAKRNRDRTQNDKCRATRQSQDEQIGDQRSVASRQVTSATIPIALGRKLLS